MGVAKHASHVASVLRACALPNWTSNNYRDLEIDRDNGECGSWLLKRLNYNFVSSSMIVT